MNLRSLGLLIAASFVSAFTVACSGDGSTGPDSDPTSTQEEVVGSPSASTTDAKCVQRELCARDAHWDRQLCACVSDACVETRACAINAHWDAKRCACVPNIQCIKAPCP